MLNSDAYEILVGVVLYSGLIGSSVDLANETDLGQGYSGNLSRFFYVLRNRELKISGNF